MTCGGSTQYHSTLCDGAATVLLVRSKLEKNKKVKLVFIPFHIFPYLQNTIIIIRSSTRSLSRVLIGGQLAYPSCHMLRVEIVDLTYVTV